MSGKACQKASPNRMSRLSYLALASLTRMRGRARSSRRRALCSIRRRSFSSDIDCLCGRFMVATVSFLWRRNSYRVSGSRQKCDSCASCCLDKINTKTAMTGHQTGCSMRCTTRKTYLKGSLGEYKANPERKESLAATAATRWWWLCVKMRACERAQAAS